MQVCTEGKAYPVSLSAYADMLPNQRRPSIPPGHLTPKLTTDGHISPLGGLTVVAHSTGTRFVAWERKTKTLASNGIGSPSADRRYVAIDHRHRLG
jgi:hypothetical protein